MHSGVMLSVVIVNVVMLSAIIFSVVMLRVIIFGVIQCHNAEWWMPLY
jgi:hypothetical protein